MDDIYYVETVNFLDVAFNLLFFQISQRRTLAPICSIS